MELPVTLKEQELTQLEREKLEEARRLLRETCRLRQEIQFLQTSDCRVCWCYGEEVIVDGTFNHIDDDDTVLNEELAAAPAKRARQVVDSLANNSSNRCDRGNIDTQNAGSSRTSESEEKKARRLEQWRRAQQKTQEKVRPYIEKVKSLRAEHKKLVVEKRRLFGNFVRSHAKEAGVEHLLEIVQGFHSNVAYQLKHHAELQNIPWPQNVGPSKSLVGDKSRQTCNALARYLDQYEQMVEALFQLRDVTWKIRSKIDAEHFVSVGYVGATADDGTLYRADGSATQPAMSYEPPGSLCMGSAAQNNPLALGYAQEAGASGMTQPPDGSDAAIGMAPSDGFPSYAVQFVKLLDEAPPAALTNGSWGSYRRMIFYVEDAVSQWHKLKIATRQLGADTTTQGDGVAAMTEGLSSLSLSSGTTTQQRLRMCPAMDANRVYLKQSSYATEEFDFIEKNLSALWLIVLTAFEKRDWACYFALADYLGSLIHSNLLAFDFDAAARLRRFFGISPDGNGPTTTGFSHMTPLPREAQCPLLFELPDAVLIDVLRSVPSLSAHPMYMKVMRAICPSWAAFIDKNVRLLPSLRNAGPGAEDSPVDPRIQLPGSSDENLLPRIPVRSPRKEEPQGTGIPQGKSSDDGAELKGDENGASLPEANEHTTDGHADATHAKLAEPEREEKKLTEPKAPRSLSLILLTYDPNGVAGTDTFVATRRSDPSVPRSCPDDNPSDPTECIEFLEALIKDDVETMHRFLWNDRFLLSGAFLSAFVDERTNLFGACPSQAMRGLFLRRYFCALFRDE